MITIITKVIIVQIDKFFKKSLILLFVDKKLGKIKSNTAVKKLQTLSVQYSFNYEFFQNFFAFSKKVLITGSGLLPSISLNSSSISFCLFESEVGTCVLILI